MYQNQYLSEMQIKKIVKD